jgi:hypothetical protein
VTSLHSEDARVKSSWTVRWFESTFIAKRRHFPWSGGAPCWAFVLLILSEVSFGDPSEREIFIKIGPVKAERGNLNIVQLVGSTLRQSRISRYGKAHFEATLHANYNMSVNEGCGPGSINQCAHATSQ